MWVSVTLRGGEEESHFLYAQQKTKVFSLECETLQKCLVELKPMCVSHMTEQFHPRVYPIESHAYVHKKTCP